MSPELLKQKGFLKHASIQTKVLQIYIGWILPKLYINRSNF